MQSTIVLARVEKDAIKVIRSLNDAEIKEIRDCNKELSDFNKHFKLVEYVLHNFSCLKSGIEKSIRDFAVSDVTMGGHDLDRVAQEVNINLLNLMMSARTFLDHMETFIKRQYGKESDQIKLFKKLTAEEFDNNFSYKFMYRLRNYVQHCGMPPLSYSKKKDIENEKPYVVLNMEFDRDALLSNFDEWGKIVKPELESQLEKFNAAPIIEEFVVSILRIYINFNDATKFEKTLQSRTRISEIIAQHEQYFADDYCLFKPSERTGIEVTCSISWIPASLFQKIEQYLTLRGQI